MVAGWLGLEQQPPSAAPRVTGRPSSGSTPPTLNWEGSRKGDLKIVCSISHGQVAEPRRGNPYLGPNNTRTKKILIGTWNVRTLLDLDNNERPHRRTALIAYELQKYDIDIAALNETRFSDEGSITESGEGYTFLWKGLNEGDPRFHGVAFAVKTKLLNNIPHSPTGHNERLISWRIPITNRRYVTLVNVYTPTLVSDDEIKDPFYAQLNDIIQAIPREDKIILLGDFNARVGSSHHLWEGVLGRHGVAHLTLPAPTKDPISTEYLTEKWDSISEVLLNTAKDVLGFSKRRHRDWFDEQSGGIHQLIDEKNRAHQAVIVNPNPTTRGKLADLRSKVQHETRKMQNEWWTNLATEIQGFADTGDQHQFYNALKTAYGPRSNNLCPVRSADGSTLFTEKTDIVRRWAVHYQELLNIQNPTDPTFLDSLPNLPTRAQHSRHGVCVKTAPGEKH
ncbi:uncharacterized protein LOC143026877 [Oratosquilla oratoria]|uniref:uncharacterized protein LOC143026877 n=1 Tax=Oratosquilla oratoria TaxID=337810 RepID=UPI003F774AAE